MVQGSMVTSGLVRMCKDKFMLYTADFYGALVDRRTLNPFHTCALLPVNF